LSFGCGTLGTDDGGAANLPFRGIGPYTALEIGENEQSSWFLSSDKADVVYREPIAIVSDEQIDLYMVEETTTDGEKYRRLIRFVLSEELTPGSAQVVLDE